MPNTDVLNVMNALHITGKSPLLMRALNAAIQAAPYDVTVLVTGENGTGKDYFYKILHNGSRRRFKKCIAVNCGGLPEGTIDSELFGHVKGAYTGAVGERKGYFEEADGGTIFLDEVGDLPMSIQAKLLRVLETGEIIRMGSSEVKKVDVRIVAATNINLEKAIREGRFRQDLYFRLSTVNIHVPALRERQEDIYLLFRKFASDMAFKYRMTEAISLTEDARQLLLAYQWPGNIRQLLHIVEEISIIETERVIDAVTLQRYLPQFVSGVSVGGGASANSTTFEPGEKQRLYMMLSELHRQLEEVRKKLGLQTSATTRHQPSLPVGSTFVTPAGDDKVSATDVKLEDVEEALEVEGNVVFQAPEVSDPPRTDSTRIRTLAEIEHEAIEEALRRNNGNKRLAAKELKISERTIHRKISEMDNEPE